MRRIGVLFALAALSVNGPRLMLTYLQADGLALSPWVEAGLLMITGLATGAVLTGGGMYIAHVLGRGHERGALRGLLVIVWLALLAFMVILLAPVMVTGLRKTDIANVLSPAWQWAWAITAVLAVEVLAAGAMIANALAGEPVTTATKRRQGSRWAKLGDALVDAAVSRIEPTQGHQRGSETDIRANTWRYSIDDARQQALASKALSKAEALDALCDIWRADPTVTLTEAGRRIGRARQTVSAYLTELVDSGRVVKTENGVRVIDGNGHRDEPILEVA